TATATAATMASAATTTQARIPTTLRIAVVSSSASPGLKRLFGMLGTPGATRGVGSGPSAGARDRVGPTFLKQFLFARACSRARRGRTRNSRLRATTSRAHATDHEEARVS